MHVCIHQRMHMLSDSGHCGGRKSSYSGGERVRRFWRREKFTPSSKIHVDQYINTHFKLNTVTVSPFVYSYFYSQMWRQRNDKEIHTPADQYKNTL